MDSSTEREIEFSPDLEINVVNHPVAEILVEVHHTELVHDVEFASSVEVQDAVEGPRMMIKVILILLQRKGVAKVQNLKKYNFSE